MAQLASIDIEKSYLHFSAAHFTIFSATNRERLHGHNWRIAVQITGEVDENGLLFDYAIFKKILKDLCARYDEYTLIAEESPYLNIESDEQYHFITHNRITQPLLKTDTILLPVKNVTIESLAHFLLDQVVGDESRLIELGITEFEMRVSSGPNQWGIARWKKGGTSFDK
ncbi:6-pyruvoyl tetrahydropterin synthase family protein [Arenicella sp. 4NH20-0111]|uniref:6-pyruvoyl trahydropterin synthase family protein n=1 Tax=Arenicella sp. 4NH20-0111 TaxID=3127648 RepID=UPI003102750B